MNETKCKNCDNPATKARIIKTTEADFDGELYSNEEVAFNEEYNHYCEKCFLAL